MSEIISKSIIQEKYQELTLQGVEDWEARTIIINDILPTDPDNDNYYEPGTSDYYFLVSKIWGLCK
jgi:hypothetical protein